MGARRGGLEPFLAGMSGAFRAVLCWFVTLIGDVSWLECGPAPH